MVRLTDRPDMTLDVYRGRITTTQQQKQNFLLFLLFVRLQNPACWEGGIKVSEREVRFNVNL